jgi:hypothetical protein
MGTFGRGHGGKRSSAIVALAAVLLLAGCAASPPPGERISYVSAIGTPFYLAAKVPVCAATLVIAVPVSALQGLAAPNNDGLQPDFRPGLDAGIQENCGPPYVLPPE